MQIDRIWHRRATAEELAAVRRIDADIANLRALLATLARERYVITNRACQRSRYRPVKFHATDEKIC